jgi:hypothetical protein
MAARVPRKSDYARARSTAPCTVHPSWIQSSSAPAPPRLKPGCLRSSSCAVSSRRRSSAACLPASSTAPTRSWMVYRVSAPLRGASNTTTPAPTKKPRRSPPEIRTILSTGSPSFSVWFCSAPWVLPDIPGVALPLRYRPHRDGLWPAASKPGCCVIRVVLPAPAPQPNALWALAPNVFRARCGLLWLTKQIIHQGIGPVNRRPVGTQKGLTVRGAGRGESWRGLSVTLGGYRPEVADRIRSRRNIHAPASSAAVSRVGYASQTCASLKGGRRDGRHWSTGSALLRARHQPQILHRQAGIPVKGLIRRARRAPGTRPFLAFREPGPSRHRKGIHELSRPPILWYNGVHWKG